MTTTHSLFQRPGGRVSATVKRALPAALADAPVKSIKTVYGDRDVVTVVYSVETPDEIIPHAKFMGTCCALLTHLEETDVCPALLRGVSEHPDDAVPFVWLLRPEWAGAYMRDDISETELLRRVARTSYHLNDDRGAAPPQGGAA
jgi:hypothetical protein